MAAFVPTCRETDKPVRPFARSRRSGGGIALECGGLAGPHPWRLPLFLPFRPPVPRPTSPEATPLALDPFAFWPTRASRIEGLGGAEPATGSSSREHYVFHTTHHLAEPGTARFAGRFTGLMGDPGAILTLRVRAMPLSRAYATTVIEQRITLAELMARGGRWDIAFPARDGRLYAAVGRLSCGRAARATGLDVALHGWSDGGWYRRRLEAAAPRLFGPDPAGRSARQAQARGLLSDTMATMADPLSQMCTAHQMAEPATLNWLKRLGWAPSRHRKQWEILYILAVLNHQGMIVPGARGLGFGCGRELTPSFLAAQGCRVTATDQAIGRAAASGWVDTGQHSHHPEGLHWPGLCPLDGFQERVRFRTVDMTAIPPELKGYDFCWSACALEHLGSLNAGLRFITRSLDCLRPGGVAVHTTEFNLLSNRSTIRRGGTVLYRRRDMERLAMGLSDAGHHVLPLRFDPGDQPLDNHVDVPPFRDDPHLRLALGRYAATSFGFAVVKGTAG